MAADKSTFFSDTLTFIDGALGASLINKVGNFIEGIAPIFATLFAIYIMLWVFNYWANGGLVEMGVDFIKKLIAWSLVIAFAFNATEYTSLAKIIFELDSSISGLFNAGKYDGNTLDIQMDNFNDIAVIIHQEWDNLGWFDSMFDSLKYYIALFELRLFGGLFLLVCFAYYILAKVLLAVTLLIGPLFIAFGLFPATRNFMTNWLNQCFNYIITCVLIGLVGTLQTQYLSLITPNGEWNIAQLELFELSLILGTFLFSLIIWSIPSLAAALTGGGASVNGHGRAVGNIIGGVGGGVTGVAKGGKKLFDKLFSNKITPTK